MIPSNVLKLAQHLNVPSPDWYVASAESGRGAGALAALEQPATRAPVEAEGELADVAPEPGPINPD